MMLAPELQQQNADTRVEIELAARLGRGDDAPAWLVDVLEENEVDPESGILVEFDSVIEDQEIYSYGTWLARPERFWAFEVRQAREPGAEPRVEVFEEITAVTSTSAHIHGIGKSFGALALEVLAEFFPPGR